MRQAESGGDARHFTAVATLLFFNKHPTFPIRIVSTRRSQCLNRGGFFFNLDKSLPDDAGAEGLDASVGDSLVPLERLSWSDACTLHTSQQNFLWSTKELMCG
jgi:hypothetical protein